MTQRAANKTRGFIGPIGDDIPSLFPIVAGILVFLLSISFIQSQIDDRNAYIKVRRDALSVSYLATEKGLLDAEGFAQKCTQLKDLATKKQLNFALLLKNYCSNSQKQVELDNSELLTYRPENLDGICSSVPELEGAPPGQPLQVPGKDTVVMTYPVAVYCNEDRTLRGPGMISVIGWRKN